MPIPGPTTYADLHPDEPGFKETIMAKNPNTVYSGKSYQTPGYYDRLNLMKSLIGSDKPAGSYNGVVYSGKHTWAELGMDLPVNNSDEPAITANTANGGSETYLTSRAAAPGGSTSERQPVTDPDYVHVPQPGVDVTPVSIPESSPISPGGWMGPLFPGHDTSGTYINGTTPETVAPADSPTSSIAGAAVAGIAALFLLSALK